MLYVARLAAKLNGRMKTLFALAPSLATALAPIGEQLGRLWNSDTFTSASIQTLLDDPLVDCAKARHALGYNPRPLEATVRDLINAWRSSGELKQKTRN